MNLSRSSDDFGHLISKHINDTTLI